MDDRVPIRTAVDTHNSQDVLMSPAQKLADLSPDQIREKVKVGYSAVASGDSLGVADPAAQAQAFGYSAERLSCAPLEANLGLGCGDPTGRAQLALGETVLDLGCGAGIDVFIASKAVGPSGRVIGVDMTPALLAQAAETAAAGHYGNVEFLLGTMEALPVEDESVDIIVSNCAINLSPEKHLVFAEALRVLRPGGRLQVSDLVIEKPLPVEILTSVEAYVGCVGGAIQPTEYVELVRAAGFSDVNVIVEYALGDIIQPSDSRVQEVLADAGVNYSDAEIIDALSSIKGLSVRAQKAGAPSCCAAPADPDQTNREQTDHAPDSRQPYNDLLSYVVSNAVAGEIMAVENYSDMVSLFDDIDAKLEAVNQAREEGRHVKQLASLGARVGFEVKQRIIEPEWESIRSAFREAVRREDLAACLVIQDLMTESLAIVLYETLSGVHGHNTDELTKQVAGTILENELEHLAIGIQRLRELRAQNPDAVDNALAWAHPRVMPQLFSVMTTNCESLCGELSLDCATLDPATIGADLDLIRARAAAQYCDALDSVGFGSNVADPLMSQMAAYELSQTENRLDVGPSPCC